ncbi:MAG: NAD(P)H-dependent oxidoreductase subunit E [Dehalococcoidia bacterium]
MPLETESKARVRALVAEFRPEHGDLLAAFHKVQHEFGYLSREAMEVIAEQLDLFPAHVYGAASFYEEFRFEPPARTNIRWCSGPACRLRNANGIRDALLATLGLDKVDAQTEDGRVGVILGQCNGTCEIAPMVWLEQHETHTIRPVGGMSAARAVRMARALRDGAEIDAALRDAGITEGVASA